MGNLLKILLVVALYAAFVAMISIAGDIAEEKGHKEGVCMPDKLIGDTIDNRAVCQLPDGGTELRKWK